jgi:(p)ppGpp synthase/HD superfamily hydrolase
MPTIEDAIVLAVRVHRGQVDKVGAPYLLHPLRVMSAMHTHAERIVAVLHDVVEDSDCTLADLAAAGYPPVVVEAVDALSRRSGEDYSDYVARLKLNPLARRVRLRDLEHNMDLRRLPAVLDKDLQRLQRYRQAWDELAPSE